MKPLSVGIREAKVNLSRLLKTVQKGHEIILTQRGRPIARLVAIDTKSVPLEERIKRLEDMGLIERRSTRPRRQVPPAIPLAGDYAQTILQEDREDAAG
jgi:prevent-host-death family protein